ncbi:FAD-dependent oxidoreductase [Odoribacter laneus]|uniref:glycerol-3-phosphate dehydrogenase/oxidase n=1 Tax=Odoribacter laneus TaxID=626933 RepID=UPI003AF708FE
MKRNELIKQISDTTKTWDVVIVGGGATGLGCAVDAATRGYSVALFEWEDFAKATSSRSTKLVHGGVRYLAQGDVPLVLEALHERGLLKKNAPHLVKDQCFLIPNYRHWDNFLYTVGLTVYDILAGRLSFGRSKYISSKKTVQYLPIVQEKGLKGGVVYHDGQFDDSRLAINLAQSCVEKGGCPLNRMQVVGILHNAAGVAAGVKVKDLLSGQLYEVKAKAVINATGIFVDSIMEMDVPTHEHMVKPSQGVHLVLDRSFLQSDYAIMIPKTDDGRVLFAVPWHDKVVVGTTDTVREKPELEPQALEKEIEFILNTAGRYMKRKPERKDVFSVFAGLRPLAAPKKEGKSTKEISRSHKIFVSRNKMVTITGGKWTTYRKMAEDTIDKAIDLGLLEKRKCVTKDFKIHGYQLNPDLKDHLYIYGSDIPALKALMASDPAMAEKLHPKYNYTVAEVVWAIREEMALTVEDILARRVRLLFLDARVAVEIAPEVARIIAQELGYNQAWIEEQVREFTALSKHYILE